MAAWRFRRSVNPCSCALATYCSVRASESLRSCAPCSCAVRMPAIWRAISFCIIVPSALVSTPLLRRKADKSRGRVRARAAISRASSASMASRRAARLRSKSSMRLRRARSRRAISRSCWRRESCISSIACSNSSSLFSRSFLSSAVISPARENMLLPIEMPSKTKYTGQVDPLRRNVRMRVDIP